MYLFKSLIEQMSDKYVQCIGKAWRERTNNKIKAVAISTFFMNKK